MSRCRLLLKEEPLVIDKELSKIIGLNEAIVLQQIEYWININKKAQKEKSFKDGYYWTYNTIDEWNEQFPFWSYDTVKRVLKKLKNMDLLITDRYNEKKYDRTLWYRINYDKLNLIEDEFYNRAKCTIEQNSHSEQQNDVEPLKIDNSAKCPDEKVQNALMEKCKMPQPIPKTKTKTKTETNTTQRDLACSILDNPNKDLIEQQTHLTLTPNQTKKVSKWDMKKIYTAIELFKRENGEYFMLLEKIYADSRNFAPNTSKKGKFHSYDQRNYNFEELERKLLGWDK